MERIDKVLSNQTAYSRKEIKELIHAKRVRVNDRIVARGEEKIESETDHIYLDNQEIEVKKYVYLLLYKPKGYVSATTDSKEKTVLDLVPSNWSHRKLFPAGRLDKDTTGMMILTDDGAFAHNILSPKKHVQKTYEVEIDIPLTKEMEESFQKGVVLEDGICKPAKLDILDAYHAIVTLTEGRYHQIKRMFEKYHAKVLELKRIGMGKLFLPEDMKEYDIREISPKGLEQIQEKGE
ncbi:MAG: rRNA pseudouridine synthase [Bacilli bacterium]|nr:rRNA pseudouridine synthase [Bacilli bacterium]